MCEITHLGSVQDHTGVPFASIVNKSPLTLKWAAIGVRDMGHIFLFSYLFARLGVKVISLTFTHLALGESKHLKGRTKL